MNDFVKLYNILTTFLGDPKNSDSSDEHQYQFECPCCQETNGTNYNPSSLKYNLEVNLGLSKYHCWACGETHNMRGNITNLIKRYGNKKLLKEYVDEIISIKKNKLYDINLFKDEINNLNESISLGLPPTFTPINFTNSKHFKAIDYLKGRGITKEIIERFKIGVTTWEETDFKYRNKIIIPSFDKLGILNYWVGRDYSGKKVRFKYINPLVNKTEIIFNEININWDGDVYLVEGVFDMFGLPPNTIPLLGRELNKDYLLFNILMNKCRGNIYIFFDGDALKAVKKTYKNLNIGKLKNRIFYIPINEDDDPGTIFQNYNKKGVIYHIKNARKFNEIDLLIN